MNEEGLGTIYYAAFVQSKETESRVLRRGTATTKASQNEAENLYVINTDIGDCFIGTEENIFTKPYGGEEMLYAFGKTKAETIPRLKKFLDDEQKKIEKRLEDMEYERKAIEAATEWEEEAKERRNER